MRTWVATPTCTPSRYCPQQREHRQPPAVPLSNIYASRSQLLWCVTSLSCLLFVCVALQGKPAIVFYDITTSALQFIRAYDDVGINWPATPVTLDNRGKVGSYCRSYMFGDRLAIAYRDDDIKGLRFLIASDAAATTWEPSVVVDTGSGSYGVGTVSGYMVCGGVCILCVCLCEREGVQGCESAPHNKRNILRVD